jgi:triacylglycerol lipase
MILAAMHPSMYRSGAIWMALCGFCQLILGNPAYALLQQADTAPGIRRVVLVHGIYNSGNRMNGMKRYLEARGWQVYAVSIKPNDASITFDAMGAQLADFINANIPRGEKFDLVGFSMGGLVSRYYVQKMDGYRRVRRFVTVSAPNHGTFWASLGWLPGVKQMRPDSAMLRDLNGDLSKLAPLGYTSIYTPLDLSIIPATSSRMPVGRNVVVWAPLHPLMTMLPRPLNAVAQALED